MNGYDVIGDIHGHAAALEALLRRMGYTPKGAGWVPPAGRRAVFVGDLIDRGPEQKRVVEIVRSMVDAGAAKCVMGNHEYNAVCWATPRRDARGDEVPGEFLRKRSAKNMGQHRAFLEQVGAGSSTHRDYIDWFRTLPVALDLGGIRVAHAWWNDDHVALLDQRMARGLDDAFLQEASVKGSEAWAAIEGVTKGLEMDLPDGVTFLDHEGIERDEARIRWWLPRGSSFRAAAFVGSDQQYRLPDHIPVPPVDGMGAVGGAPVFIGHYWLEGRPAPQSPKVACCDYSVARHGSLVAYRWSGEAELVAANFIEAG